MWRSGVSAAEFSPGAAWLGVVCYGLQIYFDFSGYSMAIGLARMFGFRFLENFNYPYAATSIQDFWRRWHITLSAWFRALLARHFGEVEMLSRPTWPAAFDGALIAQRKADVAMIEIAERSLPELLQPPHGLTRACEPSAEPERR